MAVNGVVSVIHPSMVGNGNNGNNLPIGIVEAIQAKLQERRAGAASKITPELVDVLINEVVGGSTEKAACQKAGVSVQTLWSWKQLVPGFSELIADAHKAQVAARIDNIQQTMEETDVDSLDPKLAMAHLRRQEQLFKANLEVAKRRDPATWGDRMQNMNLNINTNISPVDLSKYR